jgi:hypothetical protein
LSELIAQRFHHLNQGTIGFDNFRQTGAAHGPDVANLPIISVRRAPVPFLQTVFKAFKGLFAVKEERVKIRFRGLLHFLQMIFLQGCVSIQRMLKFIG